MAAKYQIKEGEKFRTVIADIATATAIEAGDLVTLSSGLVIKATNTSAKIAFAPKAHPANSGTTIEITVGNDFTLLGTMDVVFAQAYKGVSYDINATTQTIDQGGTTYKVLTVQPGATSGTIGSASNVEVRIALPLDI